MKKIATIDRYLDYPPVRDLYPDIVLDTLKPPLTMWDMTKSAIRVVLFSDYDGFCAEGTRQIFFMAFLKLIFFKKIILVCRPRLKPPPKSLLKYIREWLKIQVFKMGVNHFIVISNSEVEAYHKYWGIKKERMTYIPFKVNSSDLLSKMEIGEENFIYSGGDSLRDYKTLFKAVEGLDIKVNIVTNLDFGTNPVPGNVCIINNSGTFSEFYTPCSRACFAVFPIESGYIRSAGQGSYLGAMFLGKAVIVSDTPGVRDIIDNGINGIIVPPGDAKLLREKILILWEDRTLRHRLGRTAQTQAREYYTHDRYIDNIYKVFQKTLTT
ncbi:MAG: glycosyltransferase [Syntrophales bacterium]|nr:glycosyltransferase [Syntrophales bacterium]